jgi:hypothetical protein
MENVNYVPELVHVIQLGNALPSAYVTVYDTVNLELKLVGEIVQ